MIKPIIIPIPRYAKPSYWEGYLIFLELSQYEASFRLLSHIAYSGLKKIVSL